MAHRIDFLQKFTSSNADALAGSALDPMPGPGFLRIYATFRQLELGASIYRRAPVVTQVPLLTIQLSMPSNLIGRRRFRKAKK